jgi:cell division protein ZapA
MKPQNSLTINILDKDYRVSCSPEEEENLLASANTLNKRLNEIKKKGAVIGTERIAIMAALNMSHELLTGKIIEIENTNLNERISSLSDRIDREIREVRLV